MTLEQSVWTQAQNLHTKQNIDDPSSLGTTISDQSSTYSELAQTSITSSQSIGLQSVQTSINLIKEKLKNIQVICLTTDAWASLNNQSFITHNAHYMDDNTKLSIILLGCHNFLENI